MKANNKSNGFNASALQVRRAYEVTFNARIPSGMTYAEASQAIVDAHGMDAAKEIITTMDNDPKSEAFELFNFDGTRKETN